MTGLERIIEKIDADSQKNCASIIADAQEKAKQDENEAEKARANAVSELIATAEDRAREIEHRGESSAKQIERQTLLRYRIDAVNRALEGALLAIGELEADKYFDAVQRLAIANANKGEGVLRFSEKDLARLPSDLMKKLSDSLPTGCSLKLSDKPVDGIRSGFTISYGDIDVNCTFDALAQDRRDELKELICSIIL